MHVSCHLLKLGINVFVFAAAGESEPSWAGVTFNTELPELVRGAAQN